mmetsp:Transcript_42055/g.63515  ORF Transcript_42055/g.63515 Transcript_42055/m.63515 type:complete len:135 (+) Transcript_42055:179-583(+)
MKKNTAQQPVLYIAQQWQDATKKAGGLSMCARWQSSKCGSQGFFEYPGPKEADVSIKNENKDHLELCSKARCSGCMSACKILKCLARRRNDPSNAVPFSQPNSFTYKNTQGTCRCTVADPLRGQHRMSHSPTAI